MKSLREFRGRHAGATILVCGLGASLNELKRPERFLTIGVNDIGRRFHPNYLVVLNRKDQFSPERWEHIEHSHADYLFTQLDLPVSTERIVKCVLGECGGTDINGADVLHHTKNSPYVALYLAAYMGARRIGLIGVDFTDHHFFAPTGRHRLAGELAEIDKEYRNLGSALRQSGIEVFNLSRKSALTAFPKLAIGEFTGLESKAPQVCSDDRRLKIVSYATTPLAGVPAVLARCIEARTPHTARCVWRDRSYSNGVYFKGDVEYVSDHRMGLALVWEADAVIVHNGKVEPNHRHLLKGKRLVTLAHNYMWNVDARLVGRDNPGLVVGQYQASLPEFRDWRTVPNPVPIWEREYSPGEKNPEVTICYAPSGKHERYNRDDRLYWHSKGYETTMRILDKLARDRPIRLEVTRGRPLPHAEVLAMKRRSHIVIDECVTGSYHRSSLEGLAAGCAVVNGLGLVPEIQEKFHECAGTGAGVPFVKASLATLEDSLVALVENGAEALQKMGLANRRWMERHWEFEQQWERFWRPAVEGTE